MIKILKKMKIMKESKKAYLILYQIRIINLILTIHKKNKRQ